LDLPSIAADGDIDAPGGSCAAVVRAVDAVPKICLGNVRATDEYFTYLTYALGSA